MIDNQLVIYDTKCIILYMLNFYRHVYQNKGMEYLELYFTSTLNEEDVVKAVLKRYLVYKMTAESTIKFFKNVDCDSLEVVVKDYRKLFPWLDTFNIREQAFENKYELYNNEGFIFRGDTMISIQTTLKKYLYLKLGIKKLPNNVDFNRFIFNNMEFIDISEECVNFVASMHCMGNFIPVPQGFNIGRANFGRFDYWDLTMDCLYQWYLDNSNGYSNDDALELLFRHANVNYKQVTINNTKAWLKMFNNWEDFLKQNYLYCYVDRNTLEPCRLFEGHSFDHPVPETLEEMEELFTNANYFAMTRMEEMGADSINEG